GPSQNGVIVEFSNSQAAVEGRSLTLKCSTNSDVKPNVDFTWKFSDGTEVIGSRGDKQGSSGSTWSQTLTLTPSKADNRQIVKCTVKNTATQAESTGQKNLEVKYPPSDAPVISGPVFPVFEGDVITLHCSTTGGNPKPTLTWSCPGGSTSCSNTDSGETRTCTISFTANRTQNNVDCVCTPSWQYGGYTESKSRKMIIHYAPDTPSLSSVPSQPWLEHRSASLHCSLTDQGNPVATFYWIRNNNGVEHSGFNYMLTPSKEDNGDQYKCTAGNLFTDRHGQSRPESNTVQLNVYYSPRIQITLSTHDSRKEGDDLTLTCTADSNPSPSSLTWMFGGQTVGHDGSLRLTNLSREEHGQYTCEARVSAGRYGNLVNSSDVQVVVNYAPSVTFLSLNSTESNLSSIICSSDGRPGNMNFKPFSHYWNSVNIRNVTGRSVGNNQYILTFNRATYEDSGTYYCTVDNGIPDRSGTKQQRATSEVFISGTPKITKETKVDDILGVEVNKSAILQKTVFSKPNYTDIYWTKSGNNANYNLTTIKAETITLDIHKKTVEDSGYRISLNISRFRQEDIGTYTLTVCNGVGCSQFSVNLTAAGPPFPPKEFKQEGESTSDTVRLSWLPNYPGGNFKQRFKLEYKLQSESEWKTGWTSEQFTDLPQNKKVFSNITNLKANQVYDLRLSAENKRPKGNVSEFVTLKVTTK
ncbi:synaptogenesis protein syg-2-like, partial [Gigantopelta aegis]|uniref:synaptogenesis protein syg-2-like n=1 Tax=Gigantopelta aegis TaxID=1735272 RepID=UPI001B88D8C0